MCGLILAPRKYWDVDIERALNVMAYRGDGEPGHLRVERYKDWALGHVRLAIQDRSPRGNQPSRRTDSVIAFVGEFFGIELDELDFLDYALADETRFHRFDGFWAAAKINSSYGPEVYTDHLGIKPLYYWPKFNIVCSEIEPMFALEPRPPLDPVYLSNCIKFGYDYSGRTPYEGIEQLPPGTCLNLNTGTKRTYWKWHLVPQPEYCLRELVTKAVANRLIGQLPVALLLSGGLDSSIIYYVLQEMGRPIQTFSIENGESEFLPPGTRMLQPSDVSEYEAMKIMQAPLDLGSMVPQVSLARAVKEAGFHVCMTGDGADEVFGGYSRAQVYDSQYSDVFCELPYYHLPRLDRVMMRSTIELRSPFLAPQVIAFGLRLPHGYRTSKQALKYAFKSLVPTPILERKKHPLKTQAVIQGGQIYRQNLVEEFKKCNQTT